VRLIGDVPTPELSVRALLKLSATFVALVDIGSGIAAAEQVTGKVVGITDGDTITILVDRQPIQVRLAEIDTPERGQPWANRAKQALSDKVFGQVVELQVVDTDRYGRTVAKVYRGGRDINREMVREGHAWLFRKYLRDPSLLEDERKAREAGAGVWGLPEAQRVPPWEWRQGGLTRPTQPQCVVSTSESSFSCGAKRYCREMGSCEEARFYLERCGLSRLDGDGDGMPCEALCR
jgi:endonuclease YncB( thermonuclease family)